MHGSAERRSHERQKTCGLRCDVPRIERNSRAESSADGRNLRHRQDYQPASEKGTAVMAAEFLQANFPDRTGFSPRNVRQIRDFYKTYENDQKLLRQK